jgi:hypothetical protein
VSAPSVRITCPSCGRPEEIWDGAHFRMHDHDCPEMPADMANIPNEIDHTEE